MAIDKMFGQFGIVILPFTIIYSSSSASWRRQWLGLNITQQVMTCWGVQVRLQKGVYTQKKYKQ